MQPSSAPPNRTESIREMTVTRARADWTLIVAMDCQALGTWPMSVSLAGVESLTVGRGVRAERRLVVNGAEARLDLTDRWASRDHARFVKAGERWVVEDCASRNGVWVNAERVERKGLRDGAVVECGGTFFVLRRTEGVIADEGPLAARAEALRTMSPKLAEELVIARKIARSSLPVVVLGESGTGKEGTARAIHALSGREGPFVAVNCGAIPPTLIESELFGSRRGAFSGAEDRAGVLRSADRGTLFLDEFAELPLESQAALLRALQEKEVVALGSTRPISVDVRIVAATNRPIGALVDEGKLRRDFVARLSGYELNLPALRDRREDLGVLVATLIARHDRSGRPRTLSGSAARRLFAYEWPLNIRELERCLAAALAVVRGEIALEHLAPAVRGEERLSSDGNDYKRRLIGMIRRLRGNMSAVARELGTSRTQLYRILSRHSIRPADLRPSGLPPIPPGDYFLP